MVESQKTQVASVAPSLVRTATPFIVGLVGSTLATALGMDSGQINAIVAAAVGYAYYVIARFAEVFLDAKWGYVLGVKGAPIYATVESAADATARHRRDDAAAAAREEEDSPQPQEPDPKP